MTVATKAPIKPSATKPKSATVPDSEPEPVPSPPSLLANVAKERENVELMEVSSGIKRMLVIAAVAVEGARELRTVASVDHVY